MCTYLRHQDALSIKDGEYAHKSERAQAHRRQGYDPEHIPVILQPTREVHACMPTKQRRVEWGMWVNSQASNAWTKCSNEHASFEKNLEIIQARARDALIQV